MSEAQPGVGEASSRTSLRLRLMVTLSAALLPVLILASGAAYMDIRQEAEDRRRGLLLTSDRAVDGMERALDAAGLFLRSFIPEIAAGECQMVKRRVETVLPYVTNVTTFNAEGLAICSGRGQPGTIISDRDWLERLRNGERMLQTNAFYGPVSNEWLFSILHRLEDEGTGEFTGVASIAVSIAELLDAAEKFRVDDLEIALVDENGEVFGSKRFTSVNTAWLANAQDEREGVLYTTVGADNIRLDVTVAPVGPAGAFAIISRPSPGLFSGAVLGPFSVIALPLLLFVLTLGATWLAISSLLLRWLKPLRRMAVAFADGRYDFSPEANFKSAPQEITRLATTLTRMADRIGERDAALRQALATRDAAVKEIHHRVKNNLQIVTSFVSLQSRMVTDPNARHVLSAVRHRIDALSIVHQTLYQHERLETVRMQPFFDALLYHLDEALGMDDVGIELAWDVADVERSSDDAIPIALFVLEAVTNSMKYAFGSGDEGRIYIEMSVEESELVLAVSDNGRGATAEGESVEQVGLGTRLMTAFARQVHGELDVSPTASGYLVTLRMPHA